MAILGPDPWPYSIEKNRVALETLLGYAVEQGLTDRRLDIGDFRAEYARLTRRTGAVQKVQSVQVVQTVFDRAIAQLGVLRFKPRLRLIAGFLFHPFEKAVIDEFR